MLCLIVLFGLSATAKAQRGTYIITEQGRALDVAPYERALDGANFETYRRADQRRVLRFDNGLLVELYSGQELVMRGIPVNPEVLDRTGGTNVHPSIFILHASGIILEQAAMAPQD